MTSEQLPMRPEHGPERRLRDLASAFGLEEPSQDVRLTGVSLSSREVEPGDLFAALQGLKVHGATFASDAVHAGAAAILTDSAGAGLCADLGVPVLVAADPRAILGAVSAWIYGNPAERITVVGVTGTNGKTTTSYFVQAALSAVHPVTAVLGTVELRIGELAVESPRTTVEAPVLHALLAVMHERGATACSMEVSSHALALHRVDGLVFDVVGFTNLSRDHLDFHGDMAGYYRDKSRLFAAGQAKRGVVCVDDEWGVRLAAEATIPVVTVATRDHGVGRADADWVVGDATIGLDGVGSAFTLRGPGVEVAAHSPLPGVVNVSNAALAIVMSVEAGVPLAAAVEAIAVAHEIPGRMERVIERGGGFPLCIVDYAHTPDALVLALEAVRPITPGRLILVFGSDGDRDRGKRPMMGEIAARYADVLVVTDENPRSEQPDRIRAEILDGVRSVRPDDRDVHEATVSRAQAIRDALDLATERDTIIVTGKGHEPTQEIAGVFHRYNDRTVFLAVRAEREATE